MESLIKSKIEYVEALKNKIVSEIADNYVNSIQTAQRSTLSNKAQDDVYTVIQELGYQSSNANFEKLGRQLRIKKSRMAKVEMLQKLLEEYSMEQEVYEKECLKQKINELSLNNTLNPNFMVNSSGQYYRIYDNCLIEEPNVIIVKEDGSYVVRIKMNNSYDYLLTTYNTEDRPVAMKIINKEEKTYKTEVYVAKKLNLKKEYVKQHKLHGYSGNASGFVATIKNIVSKPLPSGCYLHDSYNFYKWNCKNEQFEIQLRQGTQPGSPMLSDYDIRETEVVRTDYDGVGMYI